MKINTILKKIVNRFIGPRIPHTDFAQFIKSHLPSDVQIDEYRREIASFGRKPLFSIIIPTFNSKISDLEKAIQSVRDQVYLNWEICISNEPSDDQELLDYLAQLNKEDNFKVVQREERGHITKNSNDAIKLSSGDFIAFFDHDDLLTPDALYWIVKNLNENDNLRIFYSDFDKVDESGRFTEPHFMPDFSPHLLESVMYMTHFRVYHADIVKKLGGFRVGTEGSQDLDMILRALQLIDYDQICHIPRILYHWRISDTSTARTMGQKDYVLAASKNALANYVKLNNIDAEVLDGPFPNTHYLRRSIHGKPNLLIIKSYLTDNERNEFESVIKSFNNVDFQHQSVFVNCFSSSIESQIAEYNKAIGNFDGDFVVMIGEKVSICNMSESLLRLIEPFSDFRVGVVGGKVCNKNEMVVHAGLIIGAEFQIMSAHEGFPCDHPGYMRRNSVIGNYSAISRIFCAFRKKDFVDAGEFDSEMSSYFDIDYSLKLARRNKKWNVFIPYSLANCEGEETSLMGSLYKAPSTKFLKKYKDLIPLDPFYSQNFDQRYSTFSALKV